MHALARLLGLSVHVQNEMGVVWQHQFYKSQIFCRFYIITTYLDSWISRIRYNKAAYKQDVVICDRWICDILVDLATKTHNKDFWIVAGLVGSLILCRQMQSYWSFSGMKRLY